MRCALLIVLAAGCRIGFDDVAAPESAVDGAPGVTSTTCAPAQTCAVLAEPGSEFATTCASGQLCSVDCTAAASCKIDCADATRCVVGCPPTGCEVVGCRVGACFVTCGTQGAATPAGPEVVTCP
ncbi:MAG: hypothetical protein IPQ07_44600 [Myxococcales bacterium]|nr:hypothetical protein [Myxococcales bacterium]